MQENGIIECYTDASYSKQANGSFIGFKIGDESIVTVFLPEIKNTQAELAAIDRCISECESRYPGYQIHIYTDCQKAVNNDYGDNIILHKMIGHVKKGMCDDKQQIFATVDKATRKELRKKHKEILNNMFLDTMNDSLSTN